MAGDSLFAHLATRFSTSTENLATEALVYILRRSEAASEAMVRFAQMYVPHLRGPLQFDTQDWDADDNAIPDLVGINTKAERPLIVEAKFDAALTDNQPNTYLARLPVAEPGLVLAVVPARRLDGVWDQLTARARQRFAVGDEVLVSSGRAVPVGDNHCLAIASWASLLSFLHAAVDATPGDGSGSELEQLEGLCRRLDDEAFMRLHADELTGVHGRRLLSFIAIIGGACSRLFSEGVARTEGAQGKLYWSAGADGWWGRYLALGEWKCLLRVSAYGWAHHADTPVWLQIGAGGVPAVQVVREALGDLLADRPRRVFEREGFVDVAIWLPTGVEQSVVIDHVVEQVARVAATIERAATFRV